MASWGSTTNPYHFSSKAARWETVAQAEPSFKGLQRQETLRISSYNVFMDSIRRATKHRFQLLVDVILSDTALADILILQEVSNGFLSYLLADSRIRARYSYASHGPPDQDGIHSLPSIRNIVVLSCLEFTWEYLPFKARHKGAVVMKMQGIGKVEGSNFYPLVLAGVHFTCGLSDGAVAAKKSQLSDLITHLSRKYVKNPWMVAGDFNITTSKLAIDEVVKKKAISTQSVENLASIEEMLVRADLLDTWAIAGEQSSGTDPGEFCEGEQGATFDPFRNPLAMQSVGTRFNNRPQRYDRILVRSQGFLDVQSFNLFGFPEGNLTTGKVVVGEESSEDLDTSLRYASDHWGVRAILNFIEERCPESTQPCRIDLIKTPRHLADPRTLEAALETHPSFPTDTHIHHRESIFALIRHILECHPPPTQPQNSEPSIDSNATIVVAPVGSYALDTWTATSDIDFLCIGSISAEKFFIIAETKLRKAADSGVKVMRKVDANTGTMLEIEVGSVKVDIQYCHATRFAESWPQSLSSDLYTHLPMRSLTKIKSLRDLTYLLSTIPDLPTFRTAHRFIRIWAQCRGVFAARLGFLGGIHITLMLSRVHKLLQHPSNDHTTCGPESSTEGSHGSITAPDLICSFFRYYATLDWDNEMVVDPFFDTDVQYSRLKREPLVILDIYPPRTNVARTASISSLTTLKTEFQLMDSLLCSAFAWSAFLDATGVVEKTILQRYAHFIRIDVQHWDSTAFSLSRRTSLLGWIESRCVMLLVDLKSALPGLGTRIWPVRFTRGDTGEKEGGYFEACYLIGLVYTGAGTGNDDGGREKKRNQSALQITLDRFSEMIARNQRDVDPKTAWVGVGLVKREGGSWRRQA